MDTIRLQIKKALTAHLSRVVGPVGAQVDLTGRVHRGRMLFGATDKPPFITVLESPTDGRGGEVPSAGPSREVRADQWTLFVQGWAESDRDNTTDPADQLAGAVAHTLGELYQMSERGYPVFPGVHMLGGLVTDIVVQPPIVRGADNETSGSAYFYTPVVLTLAGDVSRPFGDGL